MKKIFFLLLVAGLSISACGKAKGPKGLGDAIEVKSGYFLQLYINDRLLNSRINRPGANYSIECVYDEKANSFVVMLRDKFASRGKMFEVCKNLEASTQRTFEQFGVKTDNPVAINVLETSTKSQWHYEKGELKLVGTPPSKAKAKSKAPATKK